VSDKSTRIDVSVLVPWNSRPTDVFSPLLSLYVRWRLCMVWCHYSTARIFLWEAPSPRFSTCTYMYMYMYTYIQCNYLPSYIVAVGVQEHAEDIPVPPLLRNCLTYNEISHY